MRSHRTYVITRVIIMLIEAAGVMSLVRWKLLEILLNMGRPEPCPKHRQPMLQLHQDLF